VTVNEHHGVEEADVCKLFFFVHVAIDHQDTSA
jgi:hypothetical protein